MPVAPVFGATGRVHTMKAVTMPGLVAGLDIGSTGIKILVTDQQGGPVAIEQVPTPWHGDAQGRTMLEADDLLAAVSSLLAAISTRFDGAPISAVAISGMGETGFLLDGSNRPAAPAFAWFDRSGEAEVAALPDDLRREFAGRTGLPWGVQVSVAKLLHLRAGGLRLEGLRWFNVPEFVALSLGGDAVSEYSLASRTGLLDHETNGPWSAMLSHLGVHRDFLPPLITAGTPAGRIVSPSATAFTGAALTIAGHDHLVSAAAHGPLPPHRYHVSMGTAEVLLREVETPLDFDSRTRLGDYLINCVRHVVPGRHVLVAGVKTGLLMRRTLDLLGVTTPSARAALDDAVLALADDALRRSGVTAGGSRNDDGRLTLAVQGDGATPAHVFAAVLEHGNDEVLRLISAIDREIPPATSSLLTGGWTGMECVRRARAAILPHPEFSTRSQDTAYGAAQFAARLIDQPTDATDRWSMSP